MSFYNERAFLMGFGEGSDIYKAMTRQNYMKSRDSITDAFRERAYQDAMSQDQREWERQQAMDLMTKEDRARRQRFEDEDRTWLNKDRKYGARRRAKTDAYADEDQGMQREQHGWNRARFERQDQDYKQLQELMPQLPPELKLSAMGIRVPYAPAASASNDPNMIELRRLDQLRRLGTTKAIDPESLEEVEVVDPAIDAFIKQRTAALMQGIPVNASGQPVVQITPDGTKERPIPVSSPEEAEKYKGKWVVLNGRRGFVK